MNSIRIKLQQKKLETIDVLITRGFAQPKALELVDAFIATREIKLNYEIEFSCINQASLYKSNYVSEYLIQALDKFKRSFA